MNYRPTWSQRLCCIVLLLGRLSAHAGLLHAMSVLRTIRRQRLFKCNFKRSLTHYNGNTQTSVRGLKNSALGRPFRILFMGRDKFSCLVLEELFKARGMYEVEVLHKNFFSSD